jgi:hypothetical protein
MGRWLPGIQPGVFGKVVAALAQGSGSGEFGGIAVVRRAAGMVSV